MTSIRETFHYGNERRERVVTLESFTLESVADLIRAQATPATGAEYVNRAASDLLESGRGELGWTTWVVEKGSRCACAKNADGSVTTMLCPAHAATDPCQTMARVTGRRRKGSIRRGVCSSCGHGRDA